MYCPRCDTTSLETKTVSGRAVRVDTCATCGGLWFDAGELETVMAEAIRDIQAPLDAFESAMMCPACNRKLLRFTYPQTMVTVNQCARCKGLWLDAGEFEEIRAVRRGLAKRGDLENLDGPTGVKGKLIDLINSAIRSLK